MADELVLVFPRRLLDELGSFQGIHLAWGPYLQQILDARNTRFLPRSRVEEDPNFKQVIPYVLVRRGNALLHYVRGKGSGEKRLVAKGSIGIGGHISLNDESLFSAGREFYENAVQRELHEELKMDGTCRNRIVALLNDDSTAVGRVHFGIVHLCELHEQSITKGEACITELSFLSLKQLKSRRDQLESWSQYCLDHFSELSKIAEGQSI
jgi:predicted NUDIX family phosphoesterase